jgi:hypothetical protein
MSAFYLLIKYNGPDDYEIVFISVEGEFGLAPDIKQVVQGKS